MINDILFANYHTHTKRCKHAGGSEEEYILRAIEKGVQVLGFSDHSTHLFSTPYVSLCRMGQNEIENYVSTLRNLREKYKEKIKIHIGFEVEYYEDTWERSLKHWKDAGIEYLILGQHYAGIEERGARSVFPANDDENHLKAYASHVIDGLKTGKITYLAHPDVVNFKGSETLYESEMRKIIECAVSLDIPLEFNLLGIVLNRHYPRRDFWELAKEYSPKIILGCDAHRVQEVSNTESIVTARKMLSELGLLGNVIETIEFKKL